MTLNNELLFNTEPLLNEVNKVICKGLGEILQNFMNEYKQYKETHEGVLKLISSKTCEKVQEKETNNNQIEQIIQNKVDELSIDINNKLKEMMKCNYVLNTKLITCLNPFLTKIENCVNELNLLKQTNL